MNRRTLKTEELLSFLLPQTSFIIADQAELPKREKSQEKKRMREPGAIHVRGFLKNLVRICRSGFGGQNEADRGRSPSPPRSSFSLRFGGPMIGAPPRSYFPIAAPIRASKRRPNQGTTTLIVLCFWGFPSVFPFLSLGFRGSAGRKILVFLGWFFLAFPPKLTPPTVRVVSRQLSGKNYLAGFRCLAALRCPPGHLGVCQGMFKAFGCTPTWQKCKKCWIAGFSGIS